MKWVCAETSESQPLSGKSSSLISPHDPACLTVQGAPCAAFNCLDSPDTPVIYGFSQRTADWKEEWIAFEYIRDITLRFYC